MKSIFVGNPNSKEEQKLKLEITQACPELVFSDAPCQLEKIISIALDEEPMLFFINLIEPTVFEKTVAKELCRLESEFIILMSRENFTTNCLKYYASAYLLAPLDNNELHVALSMVVKRLKLKEDHKRRQELIDNIISKNSKDELIGIPTLEGFDFLKVEDIMRCEAMQKCTRIVTRHRSDIISSYNLGEFKKLLIQYGFYSPHKSFLINTNYIKKYMREGTIVMTDNTAVPVSRRKKQEFLSSLTHL